MIILISLIGNVMSVQPRIAHFILITFRRKLRMSNAYSAFTQPLSYSLLDIRTPFLMYGKISSMQTKLWIQTSAQIVRSKRPINQCGTLLLMMFSRILSKSKNRPASGKFTLLELAWVEDSQSSHSSTSRTLKFSRK